MTQKVTIQFSLVFLGLLFFSSSSFCTNHVVTVQNFSFFPAAVNAIVGDTITWQWVDGSHTTTCDGVFPGTSLPPGASTWDSPINSSATTFEYIIQVVGNYNYVCVPHSPNMAGMILAAPLPVELTSFSGVLSGNVVNLNWTTSTETNNKGFEIQRKIAGNWESLSFVQGHGTTTKEWVYSYKDNISSLYSNQIYYRLKQVDFNGAYEFSSEVEVSIFAPADFSLSQNFPNPFNPGTHINYNVQQNVHVLLKVYDSNGSEVTTLVDQNQIAGNYTLYFNASNFASGIYYYTISAGSFSDTKKMILIK
jgi:plastocyanin